MQCLVVPLIFRRMIKALIRFESRMTGGLNCKRQIGACTSSLSRLEFQGVWIPIQGILQCKLESQMLKRFKYVNRAAISFCRWNTRIPWNILLRSVTKRQFKNQFKHIQNKWTSTISVAPRTRTCTWATWVERYRALCRGFPHHSRDPRCTQQPNHSLRTYPMWLYRHCRWVETGTIYLW